MLEQEIKTISTLVLLISFAFIYMIKTLDFVINNKKPYRWLWILILIAMTRSLFWPLELIVQGIKFLFSPVRGEDRYE